MLVYLIVTMVNLEIMWSVALAIGVQTLTIDSQLGTSVEDCFERISIGEQLPPRAIYRNVSELTNRECEQICKQDKQCQTYDYGVGAKGNASCNLSNKDESELKKIQPLIRNPDYDVYVRRIQCEQSPPVPINANFDDPQDSNNGPLHRPIFRPHDDDAKRPLSDLPTPLRPYESATPRPYHHQDDRPDNYHQKPAFDRPPIYGVHTAQEPLFPDRPVDHRPHYMYPDKPNYNYSRPGLYDELYFQDYYQKPPSHWRPDLHYPPENDIPDFYGPVRPEPFRPLDPYGPLAYKPLRPNLPYRPEPIHPNYPFIPEDIQYHYMSRPTKRPPVHRPDDVGYDNKPPKPMDYINQYHYGYGDLGLPEPPNIPYGQPFRPDNDRPDDHSQYASGYGDSSYNDDNSIYAHIHDPPSPFRPAKPIHNRPVYNSDSAYGQSSGYENLVSNNSPSQYYGTISEIDSYHKPTTRPPNPIHEPPRPEYGTQSQDTGYGGIYKPTVSLETPDVYSKPIHVHSSYGYGGHLPEPYKPSYGSDDQKPNKPSYASNDNRPTSEPSYSSSYHHDNNIPTYDSHRPSYDTNKPSYVSNRPSYDSQPSYGISNNKPNKPFYDNHHDHNSSPPSYSSSNQEYGSHRPDYGSNQSGYGTSAQNSPPTYGSSNIVHHTYGNIQDTHSSSYEGSHNYESTNNDNDFTSYGSEKHNQKPNHSKPKPANQSGYQENLKPVYEYEFEKSKNKPSYIGSLGKPGGLVVTSRPISISNYRKPNNGREPVSYKACFRRVLAGRRALRSHVRRVVPCERLEDCRRECATENRFHCESFNYRLDPSFRGKGLCELMTKPIEAFDIRRDFVEDKDYDFYEIDRNSLEPECPDTLRGPGMLHSGFLSSRPNYVESGWKERYNGVEGWRGQDRHYEGRRPFGNRRRNQDQPYVPYQIGPPSLDRPDEPRVPYTSCCRSHYGGYTYYKDRNDYHKSLNHWRLSPEEERPYQGVTPGTAITSDFNYHSLGRKPSWSYGQGSWKRWNTSSGDWTGLDYGESNYYKKPEQHHHYEEPYHGPEDRSGEEPVLKDCSSRRRPGMSLSNGAIRRSLYAANVVECETACFNERDFKCVSYSYRYSKSRAISDNCFLSEHPYRGLDLSADSDSDVYAMQDHRCQPVSPTPFVESECFWHVRSGAAVSGPAISAALTVPGLGACEAECIRAVDFFCRGFSFRFNSPIIGEDIENCLLTSVPPTALESEHALRPSNGHELYARGNYGRGCEPAFHDTAQIGPEKCYLKYDSAARLLPSAVKGRAQVKDEEACGTACTEAPFRCLSFSFSNHGPPGVDNCLLSEIRLFDLQKEIDYEHSSSDWLFAFDLFNSQCWRKVHGQHAFEEPSHEVPRTIHPPASESSQHQGLGPVGPPYLPGPHDYIPGSGPPSGPGSKPIHPSGPDNKPGHFPDHSGPAFKPGYPEPSDPEYPDPIGPGFRPEYPPAGPSGPGFKPGYLPTGPGFKPGYPHPQPPSYKPGYLPEPSPPQYENRYPPSIPSGPGHYDPDRPDRPERPIVPSAGPGYPDREDIEPIAASWRHYTVSGLPCRRGTTCAQNQVSGHWACEPEGGEVGSWDYCCAPTHRCGYSEGFFKPWCYVGQNEDQWRPCSEKYYPYHQHSIPHPSQGPHAHHGHREDHRPNGRPPPHRPPPPYGPPEAHLSNDCRPYRGPYLPEADRRYWDDLYKNGPKAYYDKYGNPLPGYVRVPTEDRPYIRYHHNPPRPGSGQWVPVQPPNPQELEPPLPGGLGVPRYWPIAYLHKGPPPNMTYFRYNETFPTTTENYDRRDRPQPISPPREGQPPEFKRVDVDKPKGNSIEEQNHRDEKTRNITSNDDVISSLIDRNSSTTPKIDTNITTTTEKEKLAKLNESDVESIKDESINDESKKEDLKGIDGKIGDFSSSIEVLDIDDARGEKSSELRAIEAEEKQIEAIGRLLATRRGGKLVLEKRSQKDLETKHISVDKELTDYDSVSMFPRPGRKATIQKVTKEEIESERNHDKSLELSETSYVRPPRILSTTTTESIRKTLVNGKVFYDATLREPKDSFSNFTRKPKNSRLEDMKAPSVISNANLGRKKIIRARNINPIRRVRRVYKKRYNPDEVRKRLLEREKSMKIETSSIKS